MEIAISNLSYQGLNIGAMRSIPKEIGIEIFSECGNDYYWTHWLPQLMDGRTGALSVHAPFQNLDLSNPAAEFEEIRQTYLWTFEICRKYGAKHCVCHPYGGSRPEHDAPERWAEARKCCLERVLCLNEEAKSYGVELLVENMPQRRGLLDQAQFIQLFAPWEELNFLIDVGHANLQRWDMDQALRQLGPRIRAYHINDNLGDFDSHLHAWEGIFGWGPFFAGYVKYTPNAALVCEYNEGPIEKIEASVQRIQKQISAYQ